MTGVNLEPVNGRGMTSFRGSFGERGERGMGLRSCRILKETVEQNGLDWL